PPHCRQRGKRSRQPITQRPLASLHGERNVSYSLSSQLRSVSSFGFGAACLWKNAPRALRFRPRCSNFDQTLTIPSPKLNTLSSLLDNVVGSTRHWRKNVTAYRSKRLVATRDPRVGPDRASIYRHACLEPKHRHRPRSSDDRNADQARHSPDRRKPYFRSRIRHLCTARKRFRPEPLVRGRYQSRRLSGLEFFEGSAIPGCTAVQDGILHQLGWERESAVSDPAPADPELCANRADLPCRNACFLVGGG